VSSSSSNLYRDCKGFTRQQFPCRNSLPSVVKVRAGAAVARSAFASLSSLYDERSPSDDGRRFLCPLKATVSAPVS